jgi:hypothetical protein
VVLFTGLALTAIAPLIGLAQPGLTLLIAALIAAGLFGVAFWLEGQAIDRQGAETTYESFLERLGKGDRRQMDRIVRKQLARELRTLSTKIHDARTHAYREGLRERALSLKRVEMRADRARKDVAAETHGPVAYLTEASITHQQLETMLAYDETLLAKSAELGDAGEQVRQAVLDGALTEQDVKELDAALSDLEHQIQARARFIQAPEC